MTFAQLGLAEPLVRALEAKGYTTPTPIQKQSIPILLEGGDLLGIAQTGTGKTAAFVLPSIQQLVNNEKRVLPTHCRMLVLAPTRELASQIAESAREYGKFSKMSVATVFGGTSINKNRQDMARGVDILVATPGRLLDLIEQRFVSLAMLEILVLDEADQMLDLGFIHALRKIVRMLPKQRQTLFFSATMPNAIRELANQFLNDPKTVKVAPTSSTMAPSLTCLSPSMCKRPTAATRMSAWALNIPKPGMVLHPLARAATNIGVISGLVILSATNSWPVSLSTCTGVGSPSRIPTGVALQTRSNPEGSAFPLLTLPGKPSLRRAITSALRASFSSWIARCATPCARSS